MKDKDYTFSSESVSEGHPDKMADLISDTVLDRFLARDRSAKVACETLLADDLVVVAGEFFTDPLDIVQEIREALPDIVRETIRSIGYDHTFPGIDPGTCEIRLQINRQSHDIHAGVEQDDDIIGAGDQGLMFGYATDETPEMMPLPIVLAHRLMQRQARLRRDGSIPWLRPDAKAQVSVRYSPKGPDKVAAVVLSTQHTPGVTYEEIRRTVVTQIIEPVIPKALRSPDIAYLINPTGTFEIGGPQGDTGLTGRKIIVDTYGGSCPHGGGAFSGKDPTKVDRSAAYMARYIAKNIVSAGLARRCTLQLAYAIGVPEPVSVYANLHGTGSVPEARLERVIREIFDLTPAGIIDSLDLRRPIYRQTAAYGHFGRELPDFTWERTDRAHVLRSACTSAR